MSPPTLLRPKPATWECLHRNVVRLQGTSKDGTWRLVMGDWCIDCGAIHFCDESHWRLPTIQAAKQNPA